MRLTALSVHRDETLLLLCRLIQKLFQMGKQDTEYGENAVLALALYLQRNIFPISLFLLLVQYVISGSITGNRS